MSTYKITPNYIENAFQLYPEKKKQNTAGVFQISSKEIGYIFRCATWNQRVTTRPFVYIFMNVLYGQFCLILN